MTKKKIIIANWKMNPASSREASADFAKIKTATNKTKNVQTIICPPFVFLEPLVRKVNSFKCIVGAQDCFWQQEGSFTGEVSPTQLKRLNIKHVLIGHSERRKLGETNQEVNKKIISALDVGITPIVFIGESQRDQAGKFLKDVKEQIKECFYRIPKQFHKKIIVVYEPVWAISSNKKAKPATPKDCLEMSIFIRKVLTGVLNRKDAKNIPILYGGSANEENAEEFLRHGAVQGLVVGRASLYPDLFNKILKIADRA